MSLVTDVSWLCARFLHQLYWYLCAHQNECRSTWIRCSKGSWKRRHQDLSGCYCAVPCDEMAVHSSQFMMYRIKQSEKILKRVERIRRDVRDFVVAQEPDANPRSSFYHFHRKHTSWCLQSCQLIETSEQSGRYASQVVELTVSEMLSMLSAENGSNKCIQIEHAF